MVELGKATEKGDGNTLPEKLRLLDLLARTARRNDIEKSQGGRSRQADQARRQLMVQSSNQAFASMAEAPYSMAQIR